MDIKKLTIENTRAGLDNKDFSSVELTKTLFKEIKSKDIDLGAYLSLAEEGALEEAKNADEKLASGKNTNVLCGVPIALKDNMALSGLPTTAGSKILQNYISPYDGTVVKKLKASDGVILGKTNMDEFAMGSSTENSAFKVTRNPHDITRVPGGSSGGSAVATASDMAIASLGSDTGGSIRQPAGLCGVVGLKPTYGAVSRYGLIALASSLDQIGTLTKTTRDAAILFNEIAGHDPKDSTSSPNENYKDLFKSDSEDSKKLTIGIPEEYLKEGLSKDVSKSFEDVKSDLEGLGFKTKKINLPHTKYALSAYYIILPAEASTNLARYDGIRYGSRGTEKGLIETYFKNRGDGFGEEVKRRIILGTFCAFCGLL